jgi:DNA-directed RNA polymerase subunit RPC12/RpoP
LKPSKRLFQEGEICKVIHKIHAYIDEDTWEHAYPCHKCSNELWQISYRTGTKKDLGEDVKIRCTECGNWFITKEKLLSKILGEY